MELYIGETYYFEFTIFSEDGVTPLSGQEYDDFVVFMSKDGVVESLTLSGTNLFEIGSSGTYCLSFSITEVGSYYLRIKCNNDAFEAWREDRFLVRAATSGIQAIEAILKNRQTITLIDDHYYLVTWNDLGNTHLIKWRLYDKDDDNIVIEGRGPTSRGVPVA